MNARTVGVGLQTFSNYHAKTITKKDSQETRFSGKSRQGKPSSAAVLFGFAPDPVADRLKKLEEAALKNKSPLEQLIYRIGQAANGSVLH